MLQHIVMMVVGDNVMCIGLYGAVNKLIVVWIGGNEVEVVMGRKEQNMRALYNGIKYELGRTATLYDRYF